MSLWEINGYRLPPEPDPKVNNATLLGVDVNNNGVRDDADYYGDKIVLDHLIMKYKFEDLQLNTKERIKAYLDYNQNLSGGVYRSVFGLKAKALCDFNVTELLKSQL